MNIRKLVAIAVVPAALAGAALGFVGSAASADVYYDHGDNKSADSSQRTDAQPKSGKSEPNTGKSESADGEYYSVDLFGEITWTSQDGVPLVYVPAKVCVLRDNPTSVDGWSRISVDPWKIPLQNSDGKSLRAYQGLEAAYDEVNRNPEDYRADDGQGLFPVQGSYRVGDCVQGFIPFRMDGAGEPEGTVVFDTGLGQAEEFELPAE